MIVSFKEKATPTWQVRITYSNIRSYNPKYEQDTGKIPTTPYTFSRHHKNIFQEKIVFLQIPFPAITICPETKADSDKFNLTKVLDDIENKKNLTAAEKAGYEALYEVCKLLPQEPSNTEIEIVETLRNISIDFLSLSFINIGGKDKDVSKYLKETITENGICYTYNMLNYQNLYHRGIPSYLKAPKDVELSNWTAFGYGHDEPFTYPRRVMGSGRENGIELGFHIRKKDVDFACSDFAHSLRLTIHAPDEIPDTESNFYLIPLNMRSMISIEPKVMRTSSEMKHYKPVQRQCYFNGEKKLEHFKGYTQANCKHECFTSNSSLVSVLQS